ncbi:MAG TPA: hypothetical protein VKA46_33470 [Gemmataceae bacterium]|nr:hypothetical protein [Gemmataceae bacterium]
MSRWLPTAALLGALVLSSLVGCGPSAATGSAKGTHPGPSSEKSSETGKGTSKPDDHHNPG